MNNIKNKNQVERWGIYEVSMQGPAEGNPFLDVSLSARFNNGQRELMVQGFYDGEGRYVIRFMPEEIGTWAFTTQSNIDILDGKAGSFECVEPSPGNRGPVRVKDQYHFCYADGTIYYPLGTTSYGWVHQQESVVEETLKSLKKGYFNKIRMCTLPHYSEYSAQNICCFPFEGNPPYDWDYTRLNPNYFRMLERRIQALMELGIEADIILFNPYNTEWKFHCMAPETDQLYLKYIISRLSSYRNVWWSMANEYDFIKEKTMEDWNRICKTVEESDPYNHLRSIHNGTELYPHWQPWITHACVQDGLAVEKNGRATVMRNIYHKPVVYDEVCYEGNFNLRWGNLTPQEMVHRFWEGIIAGTYVGHGEVIHPPEESTDLVWTGIGGQLKGKSGERIAFLKGIMEEGPNEGFDPIDKWWYTNIAGKSGEYFLVYFGRESVEEWELEIPCRDSLLEEGMKFKVDIIDTWEMEITSIPKIFEIKKKNNYVFVDKENTKIRFPNKPYMAIRIKKI